MEFQAATLTADDAEFFGLVAESGGNLLFEGAAAPALGVVALDADGAAWRVIEARALPDGSYAWATLEPVENA